MAGRLWNAIVFFNNIFALWQTSLKTNVILIKPLQQTLPDYRLYCFQNGVITENGPHNGEIFCQCMFYTISNDQWEGHSKNISVKTHFSIPLYKSAHCHNEDYTTSTHFSFEKRQRSNEPRHEKTCLCHVRTTKAQISLRIRAVWSAPLLFAYLYLL